MKVVIEHTFTFSNEEVEALRLIYDMLGVLSDNEYEAFRDETGITAEFFTDLDYLLTFADIHRE